MFHHYDFNWRGTRREVEVVYENVREMADDRLKDRTGAWTVVMDLPFDEAHRTPADDLARLAKYKGGLTQTLVWLTAFLSPKAEADLKRYVVLDHILQGDRFETYSKDLSFVDRVQAKAVARNQRDSLRIKMIGHLEVAYRVRTEPRESIVHELSAEQQFQSLDPTLAPRPPMGVNFQAAFESLLDQLFAHRYPAHPTFDIGISARLVRNIWPAIKTAVDAPNGRTDVNDAALRKQLRSVVNPLRLGQMGETPLLIESHWQSHFSQQAAKDGGAVPLTVAQVRRWIDQPKAMGLPLELQNLIILTWALQTNRRLVHNGGPHEGDVERLADEVELREQLLPTLDDWKAAVSRAGLLLGVVAPLGLSAANVGKLVADVKKVTRERLGSAASLVEALRARCERYCRRDGAGQDGARWRTARAAQLALSALNAADDADVVATLAQLDVQTSETAMGKSITQAQALVDAMANTRWPLFDGLGRLTDQRATEAGALLKDLSALLQADEYVSGLRAGLQGLEQLATDLLTTAAPPPSPPPPALPPPNPNPDPQPKSGPDPLPPTPVNDEVIEQHDAVVLTAQAAGETLVGLQKRMVDDPSLELTVSWRLVRRRTPA